MRCDRSTLLYRSPLRFSSLLLQQEDLRLESIFDALVLIVDLIVSVYYLGLYTIDKHSYVVELAVHPSVLI